MTRFISDDAKELQRITSEYSSDCSNFASIYTLNSLKRSFKYKRLTSSHLTNIMLVIVMNERYSAVQVTLYHTFRVMSLVYTGAPSHKVGEPLLWVDR